MNCGFENLEVWQIAMNLAEAVYEATAGFPDSERFGLQNQMRRAAVSIPSNIAEGWGRGPGQANLQFARVARGSMHELKTQFLLAQRLEYVHGVSDRQILDLLTRLGAKLQAYIQSIEANVVRETETPYEYSVES